MSDQGREEESDCARVRVFVGRLVFRRVGTEPDGRTDPPAVVFENLDMQVGPLVSGQVVSTPTPSLGELLDSRVGGIETAERASGAEISPRGLNMAMLGCKVDPTIGITPVNGALDLRESVVPGVGIVSHAEIVHRRHGDATSRLVADAVRSSFVWSERGERQGTKQVEAEAAALLARGWNRMHGTQYAGFVEPDVGKYEDAWLKSDRDGEPDIPLQVTQFHCGMAAELGKRKRLSRFPLLQLRKCVQEAIDRKGSIVEAHTRSCTVLVLYCPVPLGTIQRARLRARSFRDGGFRGIWMTPSGDEAFALSGPTQKP